MRKNLALLVVVTLAGTTQAQTPTTRITFEGSDDNGLTWSGGVMGYVPGSPVLIRMRVSLINAGTNTVLGLAGCTLQPSISNWTASDSSLPFTTPDGTGVSDQPQTNTGRINPFASSGMNSSSASGLLTSFVDGGTTLRFAGANAVTPTTNLAWGVSLGQTPQNIGGTAFREGTDIVVFRYNVILTALDIHTYVVTVDPATILQSRASWYRTSAGTGSLFAPASEIVPLRIMNFPSPGALALLAISTFALPRRRR